MDVYIDACTTINAMRLGCWGSILVLPSKHYYIMEDVIEEITDRAQARLLRRTLALGLLTPAQVLDMDELVLYARLGERLGAGEAATIALAANRGGLVASDEKGRFLREANRILGPGRVLTTVDLAVEATRLGTTSLSALRAKVALRVKLAQRLGNHLQAKHLATLLLEIEASAGGGRVIGVP